MDIYFSDEYGRLNEYIESGTCETFILETPNGTVRNMFIKRELPFRIDGKTYYDIITPYGYGGPLITGLKTDNRRALCEEFGAAFNDYCRKNLIISEFVRFHPVVNNAADFKEVYSPVYMRKTLGTNLAAYDDPVQSEFSKSCRKNIRRALNNGVEFRVTEAPEQIDDFYEIYTSTMDRDHASKFYYFDKRYFSELIRTLKHHVLYIEALFEKKTIAAALYFKSGGVLHAHLSGTLSEYLYLSPAYILRYAAAVWGKEHGLRLIHHGGGTSNSESNSLYLFKKNFSKNTDFDFYVGKKIWNPVIFEKAVEISGGSGSFFPPYRSQD